MSLLTLPPELRLQIYTHIFLSPTTYLTIQALPPPSTTFRIHDPSSPSSSRISLALLLTCKTINREARNLIWKLNTLTFTLYHPSPHFPAHGYDRSGTAYRLFTLYSIFPGSATYPYLKGVGAGDVDVDLSEVIQGARRWGERNLVRDGMKAKADGVRFKVGGVTLVFHSSDDEEIVLEGEGAERKGGKREAVRRWRWNMREVWWGFWS